MVAIAISGKMGSGKTTLTQEIISQLSEAGIEAHHVSLAGPVKEVARNYFGMPSDYKDRALLQAIGQGFRKIRASVWIDLLVNSCQDSEAVYICDDVRFRNEVSALQTQNWTTIRLPVSESEQQRRLQQAYGEQWTQHWENRFEASEIDLDEIDSSAWDYIFEDLPLEAVPETAQQIVSSILNSKEVNQ